MPRVKILRAIGPFCEGQEVDLQGILTELWTRAGFVEPLDDSIPRLAEERAVRPEPEAATVRRKRRKSK